MTLQSAAVLYLINSTTVDTGTGIDVRALDDVEGGATDENQSVLNSVQGGTSERRFDPATTGSTTVSNAATTNDNKGWAVPLSAAIGDMVVVNTDCVAWLKAQSATVAWVGGITGTGTGAVGANDVFTPRASLWKYNTSSDTATLIVGGSGTATTLSAALPYGPTAYSSSVTLSVPETTFAANEVLMVVIGGQVACGAGLLGGARTCTVTVAVDVSTTNVTFATQGLRSLAQTTGSGAGSGTAAGSSSNVLGTIGAAVGAGSAAGVAGAIGGMTGSAAGTSTATAAASSVAGSTGSAAGTSTVAGLSSIVLGTIGTVTVGGGCPSDFSGSSPTKTIGGVVYDTAGAPASGATVKLFRQSDDLQIASTTTAGDGTYSFVRDAADPNTYYVVGYSDTTHHGTTDRGLVPA